MTQQNLSETHPGIAKEWDYEMNGDGKPEDFIASSGKKIYWICSTNTKCSCHRWISKICSRTRQSLRTGKLGGCPFCRKTGGKKVCIHDSIVTLNPKIAKEWNYEKNGDGKPEDYSPGSCKLIWWKCHKAKCDCHEWQASIGNRTGYQKQGCPYCSHKKLCPHNNLLAEYPDICKGWNYELNGDKRPENYSSGLGLKVWWKCLKEDACECHIWFTSIRERVIRGVDCQLCQNYTSCKHNNITISHPEITEEWDYKKNGKLRPEDFLYNSNTRIWWKCNKKGVCECHSWELPIRDRTAKNSGCQYCKGKQCPHNNLYKTHPKLIKEWDYKKNTIQPDECSKGSHIVISWICGNNPNHKYDAVLTDRTYKNSACPICRESKGERRLKEYLTSLGIEFIQQKSFPKCKYKCRLKFDFYIPLYNLLIEFDGKQHFLRDAVFFCKSKKDFENLIRNDLLKTKYTYERHNFLRIAYTEIKNIEEIVDIVLDDINNNPGSLSFYYDVLNKLPSGIKSVYDASSINLTDEERFEDVFQEILDLL
jgi:hypothetical protein